MSDKPNWVFRFLGESNSILYHKSKSIRPIRKVISNKCSINSYHIPSNGERQVFGQKLTFDRKRLWLVEITVSLEIIVFVQRADVFKCKVQYRKRLILHRWGNTKLYTIIDRGWVNGERSFYPPTPVHQWYNILLYSQTAKKRQILLP